MSDVPLLEELRSVINRRSREAASNTPDFILAKFMEDCLRAFEEATNTREDWYGRNSSGIPSWDDATFEGRDE